MNLILQAIKALFRKIEASRTHWDTRQTVTEKLTFDGVLDGREVLVMDETAKLVKVSDNPPAIEDVIGGKISFYEYGEIFSEKITEDFIFPMTDTAYAVENAIVVLADTDMGGPVIQKGVWFMCGYEDTELVYYMSSLEYTHTTGELKRLDEKYLPENINTIPIEGTSKRGTLSVEDGILVVREA